MTLNGATSLTKVRVKRSNLSWHTSEHNNTTFEAQRLPVRTCMCTCWRGLNQTGSAKIYKLMLSSVVLNFETQHNFHADVALRSAELHCQTSLLCADVRETKPEVRTFPPTCGFGWNTNLRLKSAQNHQLNTNTCLTAPLISHFNFATSFDSSKF